MVSERETGEFYFGRIGSFEGVVALLLFLVSLSFSGGQNFWHAELWNGYPRYWIVIVAGGLGCLVTVWDTLKRTGYCPRQFLLFSMGSLLLTLLLARSPIPSLWAWFFLAFYCGDYICRVMESYFLNKNHPYPDLPATAGVLLLFMESYLRLLPASWDDKPILALGIYMGIRSLWGLGKAFYGLRRYWLWTNPAI
jgi:hypothetical protein